MPIVHFGTKHFDRPNFEGSMDGFDPWEVRHIVNFNEDIPRKFIGIGCMDSNWGWLSTAYVNRYLYFYIYLYTYIAY